MAFARDQGTCCLFLPIKLGVGFIAMIVFAQSVVCLLALFTGDIRFQPNGYNLYTYRLPSITGSFGLLFGFMGLLGVYDDRFLWVWAFNRFMVVKLVTMFIAMLADHWELSKCDSWLESPEHLNTLKYGKLGINYIEGNPAMTALAEQHVCPWARWAYMLGFGIEFSFWVYFTYKALLFERELKSCVPYPVDFGQERHDAVARWRLYGVKDPRTDERQAVKKPILQEEAEPMKPMKSMYGSVEPGPADGYDTHVPQSSERASLGSASALLDWRVPVGLPTAVGKGSGR
mmetsp:Transcript_116327/g.370110  ORF Transcript_116327/g.370110 Transcript_116327/m.370110 type:complete len:288 (-) Transcript_116327:40-903(-)